MSKKLSLLSAIIININIMLGAGIFINSSVLAKEAGGLSPFIYLIVGILIFPLILGMAKLLSYHQENGTFYDFGKTISPFVGFLSGWSYFIGKLSSAGLGIHICISFLQKVVPVLNIIPTLYLDLIFVLLFVCLNLLNFKTNQAVLYYFLFAKITPILFIILSGVYLFNINNFNSTELIWSGIPQAIPLVLYVFSGFEASCSLSQHIEDPKKNGPRAILISYFFVVISAFLYQASIYGTLGHLIEYLNLTYLDICPSFFKMLNAFPKMNIVYDILHIFIATAALGSSYGILYSNSWNLHALAKYNHVFFKNLFVSLNKYGMATFCVIAEGLIAAGFLLATQGAQIPLQQVGSLGSAIAYSLSSLSLLVLLYRRKESLWIPILSIITCSILIASFVWANISRGPSGLLLIYMLIIIFGTYMFYIKHEPKKLSQFNEF